MKQTPFLVMSLCLRAALVLGILAAAAPAVRADVRTQLLREAAERALQRAGFRVVTREATETLARQIALSAAKHGDQIIVAAQRVGPKALRLVEDAAMRNPQLGAPAARLLATQGEHAVAWVFTQPQAMRQFARFGEDAASALIRHKSIAAPLIEAAGEAGGAQAVRALNAIGTQNGRRLAMLAGDGGQVAQLTRSPEMLRIIGTYGDKAMEFVWKHKFALAGTSVAATFIANPEPYINGTKELAGQVVTTVATNAVKPISEGIAQHTNWTPIILVLTTIVTLLLALRWGLLRRPAPAIAPAMPMPPPASPAVPVPPAAVVPAAAPSVVNVTSPVNP